MYACQIRYSWGWSAPHPCDFLEHAASWLEYHQRHYPAADLRVMCNDTDATAQAEAFNAHTPAQRRAYWAANRDPLTPAAIAQRNYAAMTE